MQKITFTQIQQLDAVKEAIQEESSSEDEVFDRSVRTASAGVGICLANLAKDQIFL